MSDQHGLDPGLDEDLSALIDGELSPERASELRARIDAEPALAARFEALQSVSDQLHALPGAQPSAELRETIRDRIAPVHLAGRRSLPWAGMAAAAAAAALAVYFGVPGEVEAPTPTAPAVADIDDATDEEIGIVLDYLTLETLAEIEVIEELDVLELMAERG